MKDDTISRAAALDALGERPVVWSDNDDYTLGERNQYDMDRLAIETVPSAQPECEDAVPRTSVEYICRKNTVSTNPYEHKYHDKFIQFMDDPEISDFGRWKHSNGFNTALVAVQCDLDKVPSVTPKQPGWIPVTERLPEKEGVYLVTDKTAYGAKISLRYWNIHEKDAFWSGFESDVVTAWMPLPKPWEGEGHE